MTVGLASPPSRLMVYFFFYVVAVDDKLYEFYSITQHTLTIFYHNMSLMRKKTNGRLSGLFLILALNTKVQDACRPSSSVPTWKTCHESQSRYEKLLQQLPEAVGGCRVRVRHGRRRPSGVQKCSPPEDLPRKASPRSGNIFIISIFRPGSHGAGLFGAGHLPAHFVTSAAPFG